MNRISKENVSIFKRVFNKLSSIKNMARNRSEFYDYNQYWEYLK